VNSCRDGCLLTFERKAVRATGSGGQRLSLEERDELHLLAVGARGRARRGAGERQREARDCKDE